MTEKTIDLGVMVDLRGAREGSLFIVNDVEYKMDRVVNPTCFIGVATKTNQVVRFICKPTPLTAVGDKSREVETMGEGQSRYGIMEELNNRKINEKEKLANIERETDNKVYNDEKVIAQNVQSIKHLEDSYKIVHNDAVREMQVRLKLAESERDRIITDLKAKIAEENDTFESRYQEKRKFFEEEIKKLKEDLNRYKEVQEKKIEEKKAIIAEIENGITSLKEMSKEHKAE